MTEKMKNEEISSRSIAILIILASLTIAAGTYFHAKGGGWTTYKELLNHVNAYVLRCEYSLLKRFH